MSAVEQPAPHCVVCGTQVAPDTDKCPSCGLSRPGTRGSRVLGRQGFWFLAVMLLVVYIVVLLIVAAAR